MKRFKKRYIIGLVLVLIILSLSIIKIDKVVVSGNSWYNNEEREALVFPKPLDRYFLYSFIKDKLNKKKNIPFIQEYRLDWKSPSQVEIVVYEKSILAAVNYMNLYMYFDKDGMVLESSAEKIDKIPVIEGLELSSIVLYNKLPVKDEYVFSRLISLAQSLSSYNIFAERILLYSQNQVNLYIGDIEVHFGILNDIEEKTADLNNIFPEISGQKGILYMDNYGENKSYTFEQKK